MFLKRSEYIVPMRKSTRLRRIAKIFLEKILPPTREGVEHYEKAIPAEVRDDDFYDALEMLANRPEIKTILEIGSSSGEGSTKALTDGIISRSSYEGVQLHCLEISRVRFENLQTHYSPYNFVYVHRKSSVGLDSFPTFKELRNFYKNTPSILNNYTFDEVSSWLKKDMDYLSTNLQELSNVSLDYSIFGIESVRQEFRIAEFDLVVIDGGEFLGYAEYLQLKGAKWICLDDINSFKCRQAYDELSKNNDYRLHEENWETRNGWAIFQRIN
jgi:hypothetical protein